MNHSILSMKLCDLYRLLLINIGLRYVLSILLHPYGKAGKFQLYSVGQISPPPRTLFRPARNLSSKWEFLGATFIAALPIKLQHENCICCYDLFHHD